MNLYMYIYHHISSYIIIYHHISSYIIIYHHISSYHISSYHIIYHHISSYIIIYHHISSHIIIYHHISSYIIIYHHISSHIIISYIIIYHHISSYIIIYHHISSYIIIYHHVSSYHISSYIIIYHHISSHIIIYHHISIYPTHIDILHLNSSAFVALMPWTSLDSAVPSDGSHSLGRRTFDSLQLWYALRSDFGSLSAGWRPNNDTNMFRATILKGTHTCVMYYVYSNYIYTQKCEVRFPTSHFLCFVSLSHSPTAAE